MNRNSYSVQGYILLAVVCRLEKGLERLLVVGNVSDARVERLQEGVKSVVIGWGGWEWVNYMLLTSIHANFQCFIARPLYVESALVHWSRFFKQDKAATAIRVLANVSFHFPLKDHDHHPRLENSTRTRSRFVTATYGLVGGMQLSSNSCTVCRQKST